MADDATAPGDRLAAVVALRDLLLHLEDDGVEAAVRAGWRWSDIADALGVTPQAVHKKHARRLRDRGVQKER